MLIALTLAAALTGQAAPAPASPPEIIRDVRVFARGGPDGGTEMDKNGDGFVTRDEFTAPQATAFDLLDADKDGRISTDEFASGRAAARVILGGAGGPGGPGNVRFQLGGPAGPGPIGDGGVVVVRRDGPGGPVGRGHVELRSLTGPQGLDGPGDLDKDHDGKVSEAEFLAPVREAFQRMDADRSGSLEGGESGPGAGVFVMRAGGSDVAPGRRPAD